MNEEAMRQALRQCIELKGTQILSDKSQFRGAVQDLLPGLGLQKERTLLIIAAENFSLGKQLLEAPPETTARQHLALLLLKDIIDNGISPDAARAVVQCFTDALDWNVKIPAGSAVPPRPSPEPLNSCRHQNIDFSAFRCRDCGLELYGLFSANSYKPYEQLRKKERNGVLLSINENCSGTLVLPPQITALGDDCLSEQQDLREVVLPPSLRSIGRYAFDNCPALNFLNVPQTVTSIGEAAFHGLKRVCYAGSAAGSPWGANEHVASYKPAPLPPQPLQLTTDAPPQPAPRPAANPPQPVQPQGSSDSFIADKANNDFAYYGRSDLHKAAIPNGAASVGDFAFTGCSGLTEIVIPDSVSKIGQCAFFKCAALTSLNLPKSLSYIGLNAFNSCFGLTEINIPCSVTYIGQGAFSGIKRVVYDGPAAGSPWGAKDHIKNGSTFSPPSQPAPFSNLKQPGQPAPHTPPQSVQPKAPVVLTADKADNHFAYERRDDFNEAIIPESVASIGDFAFLNCRSLTSVVIPGSVKSIGDNAFSGCSKLKEVVVPYGVEYIGDNAFNACISLTRAVLPDTVKHIGRDAFRNCISLYFVSDPADLAEIGDDAFENCPKLKSLPKAKTWFQRWFD